MLNSNFSTKFSFLLNILRSHVSVNIHVIKINLADEWHIIYLSDPPNTLLFVGVGIGYKISVKLNFYA